MVREASPSEIEIHTKFLRDLSNASTTSAILLFIRKNDIEINKSSPKDFYDLTLSAACDINFSSKNLHYLTLSQEGIILTSSEKESAHNLIIGELFYTIARYLNFPNCTDSNYRKYTFLKLQSILDLSPSEKQEFFKKKGKFDSLKKLLIPIIKSDSGYPSIDFYRKSLDAYNKKIMKRPNNEITVSFKKKWTTAYTSTCTYLKIHNKNNLYEKVAELFLQSIETKQSFTKALNEFNHIVLQPIFVTDEFENILLILETLSAYDKIVCFENCTWVKPLFTLLETRGFKGASKGLLPDNQEIIGVSPQENIFSETEISDFCTRIVYGNTDSCFLLEKKDDPPSPFDFFNTSSNTFSPNPTIDHSLKNCACCSTPLEAFKAYAESENVVYCSLDCMLTMIREKEKNNTVQLLSLCDENHLLSSDEKLRLKQFGALCYLRLALLMPTLTQDHGIVYQLPHSKIINLLTQIEIEAKDQTTAWGQTVELGKYWALKVTDLKLFLEVYKHVKQTYLQTLLKNSVHESYTDLKAKESIIFDQKGQCAALQKTAFNNLKKALNLSPTTKDISLIFLYNELIECINKRVGLSVDHIEDILAVTRQPEDITKILQFNDYKKNPFIPRKKKNEFPQQKIQTSRKEIIEEGTKTIYTNLESCSLIPTLSSHNEIGFKLPQKKLKKNLCTFKSFFAGRPYSICLFKARNYVPYDLHEVQDLWKSHPWTGEAYRIKVLFALAESLQSKDHAWTVSASSGLPRIECNDENYHESIRKKLDLNHLFSRAVDAYLESYGIAEKIDNLIQISIPGQITDDEGLRKVGFFQFSFTDTTRVCIHRCFKNYDASKYISLSLRKILYEFLINSSTCEEYKQVIENLFILINEGT
ncbi:hypothetical protein H0X06_00460 [Candidatus Dependentiae bacterium]|nr:hypothetical protein [Candidatus Dependentiae bacterium]